MILWRKLLLDRCQQPMLALLECFGVFFLKVTQHGAYRDQLSPRRSYNSCRGELHVNTRIRMLNGGAHLVAILLVITYESINLYYKTFYMQ